MITHFGLFWSTADVKWKGQRALLLGREKIRLERRGAPSKAEKNTEKDFGPFVGLYCLYQEGRLIYVGEAGLGNKSTLGKRLLDHTVDHLADTWDEFSWFGRDAVDKATLSSTLDGFAQLEAVLIAIVNPGSNKQSGAFKGAIQVFQIPDENSEGDVDTKFARVMKRLEEIEAYIKPPKKAGPQPKQGSGMFVRLEKIESILLDISQRPALKPPAKKRGPKPKLLIEDIGDPEQ
jgi:hypothetical protein